MPITSEVHNRDTVSFSPNLYEVKFTSIPGATPQQLEKLTYLISGAELPGTSTDNWKIKVIADLELRDMLVNWYRIVCIEDPDTTITGTAEIHLYKKDGTPMKTYTLTGVKINWVGEIDLDWAWANRDTTFYANFDFDCCV